LDAAGRLTSHQPAGQEAGVPALPPAAVRGVTYTYTATGKRQTMTEGSGGSARSTRYVYDEQDRLRIKNMSDSTATDNLTYAYDELGAVTSISARKGYTFPAGPPYTLQNVTELGSEPNPNGAYMDYVYDGRNRLQYVYKDPAHSILAATYGFDEAGNLKTVLYGNGVQSDYQYNSRNQLRYVAAGALASFDYDDYATGDGLTWPSERRLKPSGQRRGLAEIVTINGQDHRRTVAYDYDGLNRLRAERIRSAVGVNWPSPPWAPATVPGTPATGDLLYGLDLAGNRSSRTSAGINIVVDPSVAPGGIAVLQNASGLAYDLNDRLHYVASPASYDANGNAKYQAIYLSQKTPGAVAATSGNPDEYDFENRLIRRHDASTDVTIVYDGDGNRISKTVNGTTTRYLVDEHNPTGFAQVLEERNTSANPIVTYVYGLDLCSQTRAGTTHYYGYDGQGTVRYLTSNAGTVTDSYTYDAFGILTEQLYVGSPTENLYRYAGEQWDPHLGMYYLRARYYHPDTDRFWSMDTFEGTQTDPLSLHKYLYAHVNPVNGTDPSGHEFNLIGTLVAVANQLYLAARTAFTVYNAYSRATAILDTVQDLLVVIDSLADGILDDDEALYINQLVMSYVQGKLTQLGMRLAFGKAGKVFGIIGGKLAKLKITKAGMKRLTEWHKGHKSRWKNQVRTTPLGKVHYDSEGFPDFGPYLYKGKGHTVKITLSGISRAEDFKRANAEFAKHNNGASPPAGFTWHHHQQLGTMQLVDTRAHGNAWHPGGVSIFKKLFPGTYPDE
jgi:RHS repeat-associated protein